MSASTFCSLLSALLLHLLVASVFVGAIDTVPALNVTKYVGRWYQVYADQYVYETDERDFVCVIADYGLLPGGNISVHNSARIGTSSGPVGQIYGYAFVPNSDDPGKLAVQFFGIPIPPQPYWVVKLGPDTFGDEGLYQYSIVSGKYQNKLYVLARDIDGFKRNYDASVLAWLRSAGFTQPINRPISTNQTDCQYPELQTLHSIRKGQA